MKLDRVGIIGILMIIFGLIILTTGFLNEVLMTVLWPILSGSSDGKTVLLLCIMGSILLINSLIVNSTRIQKKPFMKGLDGKKYLKWTIIIVLFTYAVGIIIELWLRFRFGVSPFTTFISVTPTETSTSITHTHVFKSVLGYTISTLGIHVPSNIHTGSSLIQYVYPLPLIIIVTFPLVYITGLLSLNGRRGVHKLILAFAVTLALISMVDGGLFSQPAMIGLGGLLVIYFLKKPFSVKNLIKPAFIIILIILAGFAIEIAGSNTHYHDVTVINQVEPLDLTGYNATITESTGNKTVFRMYSNMTDKEIFSSLSNSFKDKSGGFFVSWNLFSYF